MARKATGAVIPPKGKQRSWAIRFTANGKRQYVTLGRPEEGWTRQRAEAELERTLAQVKLGQWEPASKVEAKPADDPTFHEFASEWLEARRPELAEETYRDYRGFLSNHLLPFFASHRLSEITVREVDRYRSAKVAEGKLKPNTINVSITRMSQVLGTAVEYGLIPSNPAAGRKRRVKGHKPARPHVEPEQLMALLDAAGELDGGYSRVARPLLATLAGTGIRPGEALRLRWADVNLAARSLRVRESKTAAGIREVDLTPAVADELAILRANTPEATPGDPVFASQRKRGAGLDRSRVRQAILRPAVEKANEKLRHQGIEPMGHVTPYSLRRCFSSLRYASGDDPVYVASQMGHTTSQLSMAVYARAVKRREKLSGSTLQAFDRALEWASHTSQTAEKGRIEVGDPFTAPYQERAQGPQTA
jgi:integrase